MGGHAAPPISRGSTLIAMMQTADLGEGNNIACGGKLHATRPWAVLVEREMRSGVAYLGCTISLPSQLVNSVISSDLLVINFKA